MNKNQLTTHVAAEASVTKATANRLVGGLPSRHRRRARARLDGGHRGIREVCRPQPRRADWPQSLDREARRYRGFESTVVCHAIACP